MYGLRLTGAPITEPLTEIEVRRHLMIAEAVTAHDAYIGGLITAARKYAEDQTNRSFVTSEWILYGERAPVGRTLKLPRAPLQSVDEITYTDSSGDEQVYDSENYIVSTSQEPGVVSLAYEKLWPDVRYVADSFQVRFTAGYGDDASDVPQPLKQAMLLIIGHWFSNREDVSQVNLRQVPMAAQHLLATYRVGDEFTCYEI